MARLADLMGDAYPASEPQAIEDRNDFMPMHDEPDYEPGSGEYNFFYGNGQLHVSPIHEHDDLRQHANVPVDHDGPMAVGYVALDRGRATWMVNGNVGLSAFSRILKDYTKQVGWRWGGLTTVDGEPINDSYAPKKAMMLMDNETGDRFSFVVQGKTAHTPRLNPEQRQLLVEAGYKIAEYPGGTNMNDRLRSESPANEDLELYNLGDTTADQLKPQTDDRPRGEFECSDCGRVLPNWSEYMAHRLAERPMQDELPAEDGRFPKLDMGVPLAPHFHDRKPFVMPLASWREASRVDGFDLYSELGGWANDEGIKHYAAFINGMPVGYASVRDNGEVLMVQSAIRGKNIGHTIMERLQQIYPELTSYTSSPMGEKLARDTGWANLHGQFWKWAAGEQPKDMIEAPVPFVYDILKDKIVIGHPGQRTSDIPGVFTPGGIVEGLYNPGGKVVVQTATNVPWTVRHMTDLWYWSHPQMEVVGVELQDSDGKTTKLARVVTAAHVGQFIKQMAATDPAVWSAYQALRRAGGSVHVVGGAIRDALLQKQPKDIDLMVSGIPSEEVRHALEALPGRVDLTGKSFGVYRYNHKGHEVEIALPRTERSTGDRRVDFDVDIDHTLKPEDDFLRRDFTANAMGVNLDNGELIDPYGGAKDIENRILRTTHPSSFREDPTRLLRALLMHGRYGFNPDERTRQEIEEHANRLPFESAEAKKPILDKLFKSANPAAAIRLAHETGLLKHIFPEVESNFDFDQNNPHHSYTLGEHLLNVLDNTSRESVDPDLRIAALLHDIGKPASAWKNPETGFNHYYKGEEGQGSDHETVGAQMAENRMRALNWPVARLKRINHLIQHHMFPAFSSAKGARKFLNRVGDDHADDLLTLRWADQHGKGLTPEELNARTDVDKQRGLVEQVRSAQEPTSMSALNVNGNDLISMGLKPGPDIGKVLRQLTDDVLENPALNDRDALIERAQEYVNALPTQ